MKQKHLRLIALSLTGALALSVGVGGMSSAFAQTRGLSPGQDHIKGSNQELVAMLEQTDPETYVGYQDIIITQEQYEEIGATALDVTKNAVSDYEKVVAIEDWVNQHIAYDFDNSVVNQDAYTAFIGKEGVCQAYSNLTKAMLSYLGIPCILVNGDSTAGGHAWNMAYTAEDGWIFVDSTYSWDIVTTDVTAFSKDHQPYYSDSIQVVDGDYVFTYHNGVAVCEYRGSDTNWRIPATFQGVPTTALSTKLFNNPNANKQVETISFPATLKNIDNIAYAFKDFTSLKEFQVDDANPYFSDVDGALLDYEQTQLLVYPAGRTQTSFQVPDTVTTFAECVFQYNPYLKDVLIPASVTNLGKDLFYNNQVTIYTPAGSAAAQYAAQNGMTVKDVSQFPQSPSPEPSVAPTVEPTVAPTVEPTVAPTVEPTVAPTVEPTVAPTVEPTVAPTVEPTVAPTVEPTVAPTVEPTVAPTVEPTVAPTVEPTVAPTVEPTVAPTVEPTVAPTVEPTVAPTVEPTVAPTVEPTVAPTVGPTVAPTVEPTVAPTTEPTVAPTVEPTQNPQNGITVDNNSGTHITVGNANQVFEANTVIAVESVTGGNTYATVEKALQGLVSDMKNTAIWEINATLNGQSVQPIGKVEMTFQIPAHLSADNLKLYYVAENGAKEEIPISVDKSARTVTASLEHFSTYVLANTSTTSNTDKPQVPSTGDSQMIFFYTATMLVSAGLMVCAVVVNKRHQQ